MEVIYKNDNVYADISGLVLGDFDSKFERFLKRQIEEVLIYAGEPRYPSSDRSSASPRTTYASFSMPFIAESIEFDFH
jgi:hypothetical protein